VKWVVLVFSVALIFPVSAWLRNHPGSNRIVWIAFGFFPFGISLVPQLDIALINWSGWPGFVKGALFSALDAAALAIYLSQAKTQDPIPFRLPMLLYLGVVLLSALQAEIAQASLFYAWQLLRMFLIYLVVTRAASERSAIVPLLVGLTLGLCLEAGMASYQRVVLGDLQPNGTFSHQNLLGMISNLVMLPLFALFLSGRTGWIGVAGPLAGCIAAVLTTSRATVAFGAAGLGLLFLLSIARERTPRKVGVGIAGALALAFLVPMAISSFETRFASAPLVDGGYDERAAFIEAASSMLSDRPFGVGANNFVVVANGDGYFGRAGVTWAKGSRSAHVHNAYWLTAAETGYVGLAAMLFLMYTTLKAALVCGWRHREDRRGDLLLGLGVSLLVVYVHCYYEWIFFVSSVQYVFVFTLGLVAGVTQQVGYWRKAEDEVAVPAAIMAGTAVGASATQHTQDDEFWGIRRAEP
jgi:O-antigen ligase